MNVKKVTFVLCVSLAGLSGLVPPSLAGPGDGRTRGEWSAGDKKTERMEQVSIVCRIDGVEEIEDEHWKTVVYSAKSGAKRYRISAGPSWYIENQVSIKTGEVVDVLGFEEKTGRRTGPRRILARRIIKDGREVWLRNYDGTPLWDGCETSGGRKADRNDGRRGMEGDGKGGKGMMPGGMGGMGKMR